jgi:hypothetical protein
MIFTGDNDDQMYIVLSGTVQIIFDAFDDDIKQLGEG